MTIIESTNCFAIELKREDGTTFLASGHDAAPSLFFKRKSAVAYKKELVKHLQAKGRVIRVRMDITYR